MRWRTLKYLTGIALLQAIAVACSLINQPDEVGTDGEAGAANDSGGSGNGGGDSGGGTGGTGGGTGGWESGGGSGGWESGGSGGTGGEGGMAGMAGMAGETGDGGTGGEGDGGTGGEGDGGTGGEDTSGGGTGGVIIPCDASSDPDCTCVNDILVAKDVDGDGEGTILCEANPGQDCDDGDYDFVKNACGGCNKSLGGVPGEPCLQCGEYQCQGDSSVVCGTPSPQPRRCLDGNTRQLCVDGTWETQPDCTGSYDLCEDGRCVECRQGTFLCGAYSDDDTITRCGTTGSWESTWFASCYASSSEVCNAATGTCITGSYHPRDADFDLVPLLEQDPRPGERGRPTNDVLDADFASDFG